MMPRAITAYSFKRQQTVTYQRPSRAEALRHALATWGERYDPVERQMIKGCVAMEWPAADDFSATA